MTHPEFIAGHPVKLEPTEEDFEADEIPEPGDDEGGPADA